MTAALRAQLLLAVFVDQLKRGRKTATIRLGDKSRKYKRGQIVWITVGYQHSPREKIFAAVIDDVEVKKVASSRRATSSTTTPSSAASRRRSASSSRSTAGRSRHDDTVTVIRFSQIVERPGPQFGNGETAVAQLGACREYSFLTTWCLEAPRERVWDAIYESERWPQWWRGVVAAERPRRATRTASARWGATRGASGSPTTLDFEMTTTRVEKPHLLEGEAKGELAGVGRWRLFEEHAAVTAP